MTLVPSSPSIIAAVTAGRSNVAAATTEFLLSPERQPVLRATTRTRCGAKLAEDPDKAETPYQIRSSEPSR